jgi:hypothetical protein
MIAPRNPNSDLIPVASIEARLLSENCTKVSYGMKHSCKWRALNGRHFNAPNPNIYSAVPGDTMASVLKRLELVMRLPTVATKGALPQNNQ